MKNLFLYARALLFVLLSTGVISISLTAMEVEDPITRLENTSGKTALIIYSRKASPEEFIHRQIPSGKSLDLTQLDYNKIGYVSVAVGNTSPTELPLKDLIALEKQSSKISIPPSLIYRIEPLKKEEPQEIMKPEEKDVGKLLVSQKNSPLTDPAHMRQFTAYKTQNEEALVIGDSGTIKWRKKRLSLRQPIKLIPPTHKIQATGTSLLTRIINRSANLRSMVIIPATEPKENTISKAYTFGLRGKAQADFPLFEDIPIEFQGPAVFMLVEKETNLLQHIYRLSQDEVTLLTTVLGNKVILIINPDRTLTFTASH
ncbi:hypothetical protein H0W26_00580 [Candidatus Dependentiae bacterium]|nr:hypothetical protein [Candidatus Dependentiae bacterium]